MKASHKRIIEALRAGASLRTECNHGHITGWLNQWHPMRSRRVRYTTIEAMLDAGLLKPDYSHQRTDNLNPDGHYILA